MVSEGRKKTKPLFWGLKGRKVGGKVLINDHSFQKRMTSHGLGMLQRHRQSGNVKVLLTDSLTGGCLRIRENNAETGNSFQEDFQMDQDLGGRDIQKNTQSKRSKTGLNFPSFIEFY